MAKITTNSTSKEILEIAMPHVNKLYEDFQKWGQRNKKMLKEKSKQSKIFDLKCAMNEEEDGVIWYLVPNNMSWNQGRLTMPDGYRPCCWFRDVVTQLEYGASVGTHCTLMYSPHCLKRVRERLQIPPTKSNFETFRDMMFYTANAIQVKG